MLTLYLDLNQGDLEGYVEGKKSNEDNEKNSMEYDWREHRLGTYDVTKPYYPVEGGPGILFTCQYSEY